MHELVLTWAWCTSTPLPPQCHKNTQGLYCRHHTVQSLFMWTIKVLYSIKTFFNGDNMEIHFVFTLYSNFKPLIFKQLGKASMFKVFFWWRKIVYVSGLQQVLKFNNQGSITKGLHCYIGAMCQVVWKQIHVP